MPVSGPHRFHTARFLTKSGPHLLFLAAVAAWLVFHRGIPPAEGLVILAASAALSLLPRLKPAKEENTGRESGTADTKIREDRLRAKIREQDLRIKQIHHRVKNNFQVINSLLSLQSGFLRDEKAREAFLRSQDRVHSLALAHENLSCPDGRERVDLAEYIRALAASLLRASEKNGNRIRLDLALAPIALDAKAAISCGLILNELITNAVQHAFPGDRAGTLTVRCRRGSDSEFQLTVMDDGVGIPESVDLRDPGAMGFQVVTMLVAQLRGGIELIRGPGARFDIRFRDPA
jgi:two-component sensor histidine kinase